MGRTNVLVNGKTIRSCFSLSSGSLAPGTRFEIGTGRDFFRAAATMQGGGHRLMRRPARMDW